MIISVGIMNQTFVVVEFHNVKYHKSYIFLSEKPATKILKNLFRKEWHAEADALTDDDGTWTRVYNEVETVQTIGRFTVDSLLKIF